LAIRMALELWKARLPDAPIVAAAGNHLDEPETDELFIPGGWTDFTGLYGVESRKQEDVKQRSFFSNKGTVGAVGEGLLGVREDGKTTHWSGTSFAAAVVSADVVRLNPPKPPPVSPLNPKIKLGTPPTPANPEG
ncbi:MAG TPA: hypothetical protein VF065_13575, partial [Ilumatobacter sp.]